MAASPPGRAVPAAAVVAWANAVPNVLWSVLAWGPAGYFGYAHVGRGWLYGCAAASLMAYAWPAAWLRRLQLSSRLEAYQRLGVPGINRFTQHGGLVAQLLRRRYPHYRVLAGRSSLARLQSATYQQERFHWAALLFFCSLSAYALGTGRAGWALGLSLLNVGYNLYPIWLQQYLRLRLARLGSKERGGQ